MRPSSGLRSKSTFELTPPSSTTSRGETSTVNLRFPNANRPLSGLTSCANETIYALLAEMQEAEDKAELEDEGPGSMYWRNKTMSCAVMTGAEIEAELHQLASSMAVFNFDSDTDSEWNDGEESDDMLPVKQRRANTSLHRLYPQRQHKPQRPASVMELHRRVDNKLTALRSSQDSRLALQHKIRSYFHHQAQAKRDSVVRRMNREQVQLECASSDAKEQRLLMQAARRDIRMEVAKQNRQVFRAEKRQKVLGQLQDRVQKEVDHQQEVRKDFLVSSWSVIGVIGTAANKTLKAVKEVRETREREKWVANFSFSKELLSESQLKAWNNLTLFSVYSLALSKFLWIRSKRTHVDLIHTFLEDISIANLLPHCIKRLCYSVRLLQRACRRFFAAKRHHRWLLEYQWKDTIHKRVRQLNQKVQDVKEQEAVKTSSQYNYQITEDDMNKLQKGNKGSQGIQLLGTTAHQRMNELRKITQGLVLKRVELEKIPATLKSKRLDDVMVEKEEKHLVAIREWLKDYKVWKKQQKSKHTRAEFLRGANFLGGNHNDTATNKPSSPSSPPAAKDQFVGQRRHHAMKANVVQTLVQRTKKEGIQRRQAEKMRQQADKQDIILVEVEREATGGLKTDAPPPPKFWPLIPANKMRQLVDECVKQQRQLIRQRMQKAEEGRRDALKAVLASLPTVATDQSTPPPPGSNLDPNSDQMDFLIIGDGTRASTQSPTTSQHKDGTPTTSTSTSALRKVSSTTRKRPFSPSSANDDSPPSSSSHSRQGTASPLTPHSTRSSTPQTPSSAQGTPNTPKTPHSQSPTTPKSSNPNSVLDRSTSPLSRLSQNSGRKPAVSHH